MPPSGAGQPAIVRRGSPTPPKARPEVSPLFVVRRGSPTPPKARPEVSPLFVVRRGFPTPPKARPQVSPAARENRGSTGAWSGDPAPTSALRDHFMPPSDAGQPAIVRRGSPTPPKARPQVSPLFVVRRGFPTPPKARPEVSPAARENRGSTGAWSGDPAPTSGQETPPQPAVRRPRPNQALRDHIMPPSDAGQPALAPRPRRHHRAEPARARTPRTPLP